MALRVTRGGVNTFAGSGGGRRLIGGPIEAGGGGGLLNRGSFPPGLITDDALNGAALSTKHIRFHRQAIWLDSAAHTAQTLHDSTAWGRVAGTSTLFAQLGSFEDSFIAWIDASVSYTNDAANTDCTAQFALVLYTGEDTDADGVSDTFTKYQRADDVARLGLFASGRGTLVVLNTAIVVPFIDGADWWVAMQAQSTDGTTRNNCVVRNQKYRVWTTALDPTIDTNLVDDAGLS